MRLDTLCFTLGFASTIANARQLVNHGHITVNNKVINKATISFSVQDGSQTEFSAHEKLVLVRVNSSGENIFLSDFLIEGDA